MSKIERLIFYILIFCLPFQTRHIFYQWGNGFNEWTSVYLYLSDLLVVLLLAGWLWRGRSSRFFKEWPRWKELIKKPGFWLFLFVLIALISLIQADNLKLGLYSWFKLLEMVGLFCYLSSNFKLIISNIETTIKVFLASVFFQSLVALVQYAGQKSLGLKFLAESPLGPDIAGVAKVVVNGSKIIRPYGGFPHPHLLAIFILTAIFFIFSIWLGRKHSLAGYTFWSGLCALFVFVLWLILSRSILAIFIFSVLLYFFFVFRARKKLLVQKIFWLFGLLVILIAIFSLLLWPEISSRLTISLQDQSIGLRVFYSQLAFSVIKESPFLGLGLGNFVWEVRQALDLLSPWLHQPVHNIYLLITSETGLIGLILFLLFIFFCLRKFLILRPWPLFHYSLFFIFISFLLVGLFDHFFWTLQQGQLLFWLILGIWAGLGK